MIKINKRTILFKIKSLGIGLLLSILFLFLGRIYSSEIILWVNVILFGYLCFGLTYRLYQYFKKDHLFLNGTILLLISGISFLATDSLHNNQWNIPYVPAFLSDIVLYLILLIAIPSILTLLVIIGNLILTHIKKRVSLIKLVLSIVLLFTSTFIFYPPQSIKKDAVDLYFQTINPNAGMIIYEKEYKAELIKADRYREQVNKQRTEIGQNEYAKESNEYLVSLMKDNRSRSTEVLANREQSLQRLIDIDNVGQKMRIPDTQKLFYDKRKKADENELKAFQTYKITQEKVINGSIAYYGFWNEYDIALQSFFSQDPSLWTIEAITQREKKVNDFYNTEVKKSIDQKIISPEVIERIDTGFEMVTKLLDYQKLKLDDPSSKQISQKENELAQIFKAYGEKKLSNTDIFANWVDSYVTPGFYVQDTVHQASFYLYKDAYDYARKQNMLALFTVWENDYPGYEDSQEQATLNNSKESVESYYKTYENPMVQYIRVALNAYLQGDPQNTIPQTTKEKDEDEGYMYGLDSFDKDYYKSKFVVIYVENYPNGGVQYTIMFQDRPDTFFTAWVYQKIDETYELRGFSSAKTQSKEDIKKINTEFKDFLLDKEHAL